MTRSLDLGSILVDRALLLAIGEQVAPSMNGASLRRLAAVLDDVSLGDDFVDPDDAAWLRDGAAKAEDGGRLQFWATEVQRLADNGVDITSCVDPQYPSNLAMIHDRPPILFVRGDLTEADIRAVAVVGTRSASEDGVRQATRIASELATSGITVVSGLAKGYRHGRARCCDQRRGAYHCRVRNHHRQGVPGRQQRPGPVRCSFWSVRFPIPYDNAHRSLVLPCPQYHHFWALARNDRR